MSVINDHLATIGEGRRAGKTLEQIAADSGIELRLVTFYAENIPEQLASMTLQEARVQLDMPGTLYLLWKDAQPTSAVAQPTGEQSVSVPDRSSAAQESPPSTPQSRKYLSRDDTKAYMKKLYDSGVTIPQKIIAQTATHTGLKESTLRTYWGNFRSDIVEAPADSPPPTPPPVLPPPADAISTPTPAPVAATSVAPTKGVEENPAQYLRRAMRSPGWIDEIIDRYSRDNGSHSMPISVLREILGPYQESDGTASISAYVKRGERGSQYVEEAFKRLGLPLMLTDDATIGPLALGKAQVARTTHTNGTHAPPPDPLAALPLAERIQLLFDESLYIRGMDFVELGGIPRAQVISAISSSSFEQQRMIGNHAGHTLTLSTASRIYALADSEESPDTIARKIPIHRNAVDAALKGRSQYEPIIMRFLSLTRGTTFSKPYLPQVKK